MEDDKHCADCSKSFLPKASAIQCSFCNLWLHRTCTDLSLSEFNKICAATRKNKVHNWNCKHCAAVKVRCRASLSPTRDGNPEELDHLTMPKGTQPTMHNDRPGTSFFNSVEFASDKTSDDYSKLGQKIQDRLVNKQNIEMADVVLIILNIFNSINEQNTKLTNILEELKIVKSCDLKNEVAELQNEVESLKNEVKLLRSGEGSCIPTVSNEVSTDIYSEMQDRATRSKNIILHNVPESAAEDSKIRIEHDKGLISDLLSKIRINCLNFKAFRLGKRNSRGPRPLKVILFDASLVSLCLANRKLLTDSHINIRADLTPLQREQLSKAHEELAARAEVEPNLCIQYVKGMPKVVQQKNRLNTNKNKEPKN